MIQLPIIADIHNIYIIHNVLMVTYIMCYSQNTVLCCKYKIGKFTKTVNPIEQFNSRGPNFQIVETIVIWGSPNRSHCLFSPGYSAAPAKQKVINYIVLPIDEQLDLQDKSATLATVMCSVLLQKSRNQVAYLVVSFLSRHFLHLNDIWVSCPIGFR